MDVVDTSFLRRRREQLIKFERSVLRELSLEKLKKGVQRHFGTFSTGGPQMLDNAIEEGCYDVAVESYLTGSRYSRLGYFGESLDSVKSRSAEDRQNLSKALTEFITYWSGIGDNQPQDESLLRKCEDYVDYWWEEGFHKGKMKYKMKMH